MPSQRDSTTYDVIIVGGGPAGLSAALVLGRCRRRVLVCDAGNPRNAASHGMHCFITRDGIDPAAFLHTAHEELLVYGVEFRRVEVREVKTSGNEGFIGELEDGTVIRSRKVLLATGVRDRIPEIEGIMQFYGRSVHHCPYCDGWEERDKRIAVYGHSRAGYGLSLAMKTWSSDIILCTDGTPRISLKEQAKLKAHSVEIIPKKIARLEGEGPCLGTIVFADGTSIERDSLFFTTGWDQSCVIARTMGCKHTNKGSIWVDSKECSSIPGVYVAGDASRDAQLVIVAAAEGAKAAVFINMELQEEDLA